MHWELFSMTLPEIYCAMIHHLNIDQKELQKLIRTGKIKFGGNRKLKIYGTLKCSSGKRMKVENRVFFKNENEALEMGFRACKKCMKQYKRQEPG